MEKIKIKTGKKLGEGAEKTVYGDLNNPDRVVGVFKKEKELETKAKARFYLTKILHLLFPKKIRDIHASYSDPNVIINSKVGDSPWKFWKKIKYDTETIKEINSFVSELEKDFGVWIDSAPNNFMRDKNENLVYVDSINPWPIITANFNPRKLREATESLGEDSKRKGLVYLERLINLANEAGVKFLE